MIATSDEIDPATDAIEPIRVRFEVIRARVAERLGVSVDDLTDKQIAEYTGQRRDTINKLKNQPRSPLLETVVAIAEAIELPVDDVIRRGGEA